MIINQEAVMEFINAKKSSLWYQNMEISDAIQKAKEDLMEMISNKEVHTRENEGEKPDDKFNKFVDYVFVKNEEEGIVDIYTENDNFGLENLLKDFNGHGDTQVTENSMERLPKVSDREGYNYIDIHYNINKPIDSSTIIYIIYSNRRVQDIYDKTVLANICQY